MGPLFSFDRVRLALALLLGFGLVGLAVLPVFKGSLSSAALAAGSSVLCCTFAVLIVQHWHDFLHRTVKCSRDALIRNDPAPSFVANAAGMIKAKNSACADRFVPDDSGTLASALRSLFANPSAVVYRLQCRANLEQAAREEISTKRGQIRLTVHQIGPDEFAWRIEEISESAAVRSSTKALPIPMVSAGRGGAILYMNPAAQQLIGKTVENVQDLFPTLHVRPGCSNMLSTQNGPVNVFVAEHQTQSGRRELYFLDGTMDIAQEQEVAFDILPVAVIKMCVDGRIERINRHAAQLIGDNVKVGTVLPQIVQGLGRPVNSWLQDTAAGRDTNSTEFLRLKRPDREVFVQVTLGRIFEDGEPRLLAVLNDATELKTLEAQFVQGQKMQAIGQLAGGVAHDFNNLLTAISGHCDLLLLRHDHGDADYGDLVQINQNANRAAALVSQLLAFSRKQTLRPEIIDLHDTLSDLTHLLNRLVGEKVTLTLSHNPVLPAIRADKRQLEQVLMNLVVNARDAMPEGGEVRIETDTIVLSQALKRDRATLPAGRYVTVVVTDKGVGIPPDRINKVFEPFYTTKSTGEGTGLGLSTAYGIVKQTGGFIFIDSEIEVGTTFSIYFPAFEDVVPEPVVEPQNIIKPAPQHGHGVVLLVEDEAPVRAFASRALRLRGYTVIEAESAEDALEILKDPDLVVDVFVTDVVMPGLDGPSWVRTALIDRPDVRVVFVSGYSEGVFNEADSPVPNSVFLPKPFSLNQLTETVHQQLP